MENTEDGFKEPIKTQTRRRDFCAAHVTNFSLKVQCTIDFVIRPYSSILSTEIQVRSEDLCPLFWHSPSIALSF